MAHSLSAKKRNRQNVRRRAINRTRRSVLKTSTRGFMDALAKSDAVRAESEFKNLCTVVDRAASRKTIHKNTAARRKSRLARRLNALKKSATAAAAAAG